MRPLRSCCPHAGLAWGVAHTLGCGAARLQLSTILPLVDGAEVVAILAPTRATILQTRKEAVVRCDNNLLLVASSIVSSKSRRTAGKNAPGHTC